MNVPDAVKFDLIANGKTPKELGYYFPAEFARQDAMWLSWPHKEASWPGKIDAIFPVYAKFISLVSQQQKVNINIADEAMKAKALGFVTVTIRSCRTDR